MTVSELIAKLIYNLLKRLDFSGGVQVVIDEGIAGERKDFGVACFDRRDPVRN